ncbi:hypothetical protein MBANPS3_011611 [Mucor bainieri]
MESSSVFDSRRKSSSATIVPPLAHQKYNARKASLIPLKINTAGTKNLFYDTGSMAEISPTTVVSFNEVEQNQQPKSSWIDTLKKKLKLKKATTERNSIQFPEKMQQQHLHQNSRVVRHSYSDPRLSPGSTAVGDDDEEQQGYFSAMPTKKSKRTPRGWVAAVLMIVFGALIAVTFVLSNSTTATTTTTSTTAAATDQHLSVYLPTASASNTKATVTVTKAVALVHKVIKPTAIST